jgi:hypothetical protein
MKDWVYIIGLALFSYAVGGPGWFMWDLIGLAAFVALVVTIFAYVAAWEDRKGG